MAHVFNSFNKFNSIEWFIHTAIVPVPFPKKSHIFPEFQIFWVFEKSSWKSYFWFNLIKLGLRLLYRLNERLSELKGRQNTCIKSPKKSIGKKSSGKKFGNPLQYLKSHLRKKLLFRKIHILFEFTFLLRIWRISKIVWILSLIYGFIEILWVLKYFLFVLKIYEKSSEEQIIWPNFILELLPQMH